MKVCTDYDESLFAQPCVSNSFYDNTFKAFGQRWPNAAISNVKHVPYKENYIHSAVVGSTVFLDIPTVKGQKQQFSIGQTLGQHCMPNANQRPTLQQFTNVDPT